MKSSESAIKPAWLNIKDACIYAGVCRDTLMDWMELGLQVSKVGRRYLIKKENIDAFLEGFEKDSIGMDEIEKKVLAGLSS